MNHNERYYRKIIASVGLSMLLFLGLINGFAVFIMVFEALLSMLSLDEIAFNVIYDLVYGAGYLLSFMVPVGLLKSLIKHSPYPYQSMRTDARLSPWTALIVPAGIVAVFSASYVNAGMVSFFNYSEFSSEYLWSTGESSAPYILVLQFIVTCAVPGFCEEFLFRGAILTNLLPFGRSNAIFISAFLFGIMHQNPEQVFYAFAAGIVLGVVYERTGNIWACTILHTLNNFSSVFQGFIFEKFESPLIGSAAAFAFEAVLLLLGMICCAVLVVRFFSQKPNFQNGIFGKKIFAADGYAAYPIEGKRAVKLFLSPSMIIFLILCVLQILLLLFMAVLL